MKINISPLALEDLKEIREYISKDLCNEQAAQNTVNKIMGGIRSLETFPQMGSPLSAKVNIPTDYRTLIAGNYITFYRIEENEVYVSRVLYGGRNYLRLFFGELY